MKVLKSAINIFEFPFLVLLSFIALVSTMILNVFRVED